MGENTKDKMRRGKRRRGIVGEGGRSDSNSWLPYDPDIRYKCHNESLVHGSDTQMHSGLMELWSLQQATTANKATLTLTDDI